VNEAIEAAEDLEAGSEAKSRQEPPGAKGGEDTEEAREDVLEARRLDMLDDWAEASEAAAAGRAPSGATP
jgi:hypothetical protein